MTHGRCNAELLARLVASGVHSLFFRDSCDRFLQQVTMKMVQTIDLNFFPACFEAVPCRTSGTSCATARNHALPFSACMPISRERCSPLTQPRSASSRWSRRMSDCCPSSSTMCKEVDDMTTITQTRAFFLALFPRSWKSVPKCHERSTKRKLRSRGQHQHQILDEANVTCCLKKKRVWPARNHQNAFQ